MGGDGAVLGAAEIVDLADGIEEVSAGIERDPGRARCGVSLYRVHRAGREVEAHQVGALAVACGAVHGVRSVGADVG